MASNPKIFGRNLKKLRLAADESRYALSKRTGIDQSYLRYVEQGDSDVGWTRACQLADAYDVALDAFRKR